MSTQSDAESTSLTLHVFNNRIETLEAKIDTLAQSISSLTPEQFGRFAGHLVWQDGPSTVQQSKISLHMTSEMKKRGYTHTSPGIADAGIVVFFSSPNPQTEDQVDRAWGLCYRALSVELKSKVINDGCFGLKTQSGALDETLAGTERGMEGLMTQTSQTIEV